MTWFITNPISAEESETRHIVDAIHRIRNAFRTLTVTNHTPTHAAL